MRTIIRKWGNSASVRLSVALMDAAHLKLDQAVEIKAEDGRLVIEPVRDKNYSLDELLAGIHDDNLHEPVDYGGPVGRERL